jgi:hypothetical protein
MCNEAKGAVYMAVTEANPVKFQLCAGFGFLSFISADFSVDTHLLVR